MISVIVATHNRRRLLERTLTALDRQDWPRSDLEVLVVDNGSTDGTSDWLASRCKAGEWPQVRVLHESRPGKSHAVNYGVAHASGTLLVFTDDDVVPDSRWVTAMLTAMEETGADFGVGQLRPIWEISQPSWLSPALYGVLAIPDNGAERLRIATGCNEHVMPIGANMAIRSSVIRAIGGWRPDLGKLRDTLRSGEDHEFYLRMLAAGLTGVYEPSATVGHLVPAARLNRQYFRRWMRDNGRIVAALDRWYPKRVGRLFGVPRYLWRDAISNTATLLAPSALDSSTRFAAFARIDWFVGYLQGAWSDDRDVPPPADADPSRPSPRAARVFLEP